MTLTEEQTIVFLKESLSVDEDLTAESPLFSSGVLDSVAMMNLIAYVEETSGIQVRPQDVTLENFDTPARIVRFAESQS